MWSLLESTFLAGMWGQVNAFADDGTDEFRVQREDGRRYGIFKTWAFPVIPFIEWGTMDALTALWPTIRRRARSSGFRQTLDELAASAGELRRPAQLAVETIKGWRKACMFSPVRLARSLERARLYCDVADHRLMELFSEEPLPDDIGGRISELVDRLVVAIGLSQPFYHIEAVAGDATLLDPSLSAREQDSSGRLDVAAFLLPAAFRDIVVAEKGNWNGLSWRRIRRVTGEMMAHPDFRTALLRLSALTGHPPEHIVFAANAIEWTPRRVGGKKDDPIDTNAALSQLIALLEGTVADDNHISVLAEINALIRFRNWLPGIVGNENFQGSNWCYGSTCDTTSLLLETLKSNPQVWKPGFSKVFQSQILPQLSDLDATSAIGRLLLYLILDEGRLEETFFSGLNISRQCEILTRISADRPTSHNSFGDVHHRGLVGGKTHGLLLSDLALGHLSKGGFITLPQVERLVGSVPGLMYQIRQLDRHDGPLKAKLSLASTIRRRILSMEYPEWLRELVSSILGRYPDSQYWAIRSSSLDEAEARGVYLTKLRERRDMCLHAVLQCVASYYSKDAVTFREAIRAGHLLYFGVLLQPYRLAKGGGAVDDGEHWKVSVGPTAALVTSNGRIDSEWDSARHKVVTDFTVRQVVSSLDVMRRAYGPVTIEWQEGADGHLTILQMERLPRRNGKPIASKDPLHSVTLQSLRDLSDVEEHLAENGGRVKLVVQNTVDLKGFQGALLSIIVRFGSRIGEICWEGEHLSPSSHFANICAFFGIRLSS